MSDSIASTQQDVLINLRLVQDTNNRAVLANLSKDVEATVQGMVDAVAKSWDRINAANRAPMEKLTAAPVTFGSNGRFASELRATETRAAATKQEESSGLKGFAKEAGKHLLEKGAEKGAEMLLSETAAGKALTTALKGLTARVAAAAVPAAGLGTALVGAATAGVLLGEGIKSAAKAMGATGRWTESLSHYYRDVAHINKEAEETEKETEKMAADRAQVNEIEERQQRASAGYAAFHQLTTDVDREAAYRKGDEAGEKFDRKQLARASDRLANAETHLEQDQQSQPKALDWQAVEEAYKESIAAATRVFEAQQKHAIEAAARVQSAKDDLDIAKAGPAQDPDAQARLSEARQALDRAMRERDLAIKNKDKSAGDLAQLEKRYVDFLPRRYGKMQEPGYYQEVRPTTPVESDAMLYRKNRTDIDRPPMGPPPPQNEELYRWNKLPEYRKQEAKDAVEREDKANQEQWSKDAAEMARRKLEKARYDQHKADLARENARQKAAIDLLGAEPDTQPGADKAQRAQPQHRVKRHLRRQALEKHQASTDGRSLETAADDAANAAHTSVTNSERLAVALIMEVKNMAAKNQQALQHIHDEIRRTAATTNYGNNIC